MLIEPENGIRTSNHSGGRANNKPASLTFFFASSTTASNAGLGRLLPSTTGFSISAGETPSFVPRMRRAYMVLVLQERLKYSRIGIGQAFIGSSTNPPLVASALLEISAPVLL